MPSNLTSDKLNRATDPDGWRHQRETAPSVMAKDDPTFARWLGLAGLMLLTLGSVALVAIAVGTTTRISFVFASLFSIVGVSCLLFHAAVDTDLQVRRTYGILGYLWLAAGILVTVLPLRGEPVGAHFLPYGFLCLVMALLFLLPFARNETEDRWRRMVATILGVVGVALAAIGFIGGNISDVFLLGAEHKAPYGLLLVLLGLAYIWAFIGLNSTTSDLGYRAAIGLGAAGILIFLIALGRSALPPLFFSFRWISARPEPYLVPTGLVLMGLGLLYALISAALVSDNRLVVLFRRELSAFFYSPIAYIVLFSFAVVASFLFLQFAADLSRSGFEAQPFPEPVITGYLLAWFPIFCVVMAIPVLTMRLLSEENRTGSIEVLLTAPVSEVPVVLSKFFASLLFYLLIWLPWGICLIALRLEGGEPFEYRPLLSFYLMLACTGAGFLSMGLFFSSLTRNQIIAAVLTFMGMLVMTVSYFAKQLIERQSPGSAWVSLLSHISYLDLWISSLFGEITPKFYVFHLCAVVFWLFLTVKVLESRRWR
jgi:ABC-type transport system involved in multi-copper enzyme maturation permease subunit